MGVQLPPGAHGTVNEGSITNEVRDRESFGAGPQVASIFLPEAPMNKLFLDIETLPAEEDMHEILRSIHAKKIADGRTTKTLDEMIEETGLNGAFGRICCISYAFNDDKIHTLSGPEPQMLKDFWALADKTDLFVGFNILDFDLRFIWQRSIVNRIRPTRPISFVRYRSEPVYDIMYEWSHWSGGVGSRIGLDALAKALGIPTSKGGPVEGRTVAKAYAEGRLKEICEYCEKDVDVTRKIYKRLIFEE
jgi:3'-5' exonuclease